MTILQRPGVYIPLWLQSGVAHVVIVIGAFAVGLFFNLLTREWRSVQVMDFYHDAFIAPIIAIFALTLLPVLIVNLYEENGPAYWYEGLIVVFAVIIWATLVLADFETGRIDQRHYLQKLFEHGFVLKGN